MKRLKKSIFTSIAILVTLLCSIYPRYIVFASDPVSQTVTSDDNIVQKILDFSLSYWGAVYKSNDLVSKVPNTITNTMKETIASLMNGGGIYVDSNGDYVFTDAACQQLYDSMNNNSSMDAKVVSDFSNFTYFADGYINNQYLLDCNSLTAQLKVNGDYILLASRGKNYRGYTTTTITGFNANDFGYLAILDQSYGFQLGLFNTGGARIGVDTMSYSCTFNGSSYSNSGPITDNATSLWSKFNDNSYTTDSWFNAFPNLIDYNGSGSSASFYCNKSLILGKSSLAANTLNNQTTGVFSSYNTINNINKTVLEDNNWQNIYNNYIQNVVVDFQDDTTISTSDFRKILKKYSGSIIDAINSGSSSIEDTISISNRYLQAISVDVRNIVDKLDDLTSGGSSGGITPEQYNSIMGKLNDINNNAIDIASSTATISSDIDAIYDDTHGIVDDMGILLENTADTNTNLVAIDTLLQQINSKLSNRNRDNPLPDPDFWDNLDDDLVDYTNTMMEDLVFKLQMIGTVLQGVVPFGYVAVLGVILNSLAVQPEDPVFVIDLASSNTTIPLNWEGSIDLTWIDDIMPMVRAFEVILFIIGMIWSSFTIFTTLGSLFS